MKTITAVGICLTALIIVVGCNPVKRAAHKQLQTDAIIQNYLSVHPPRIDTSTKFLPGKIINNPYPVLIVDSSRMAAVKDSLQKSFAIKYKYDNYDCNRQVNEAFNTGYQQGQYDYAKAQPPQRTPDTIINTLYNTDALDAANKTAIQNEAKYQTIKSRAAIDRYTTYALIALLAIILFLYIKKLLRK